MIRSVILHIRIIFIIILGPKHLYQFLNKFNVSSSNNNKNLKMKLFFQGHSGCVNCLEWNADGRYVKFLYLITLQYMFEKAHKMHEICIRHDSTY